MDINNWWGRGGGEREKEKQRVFLFSHHSARAANETSLFFPHRTGMRCNWLRRWWDDNTDHKSITSHPHHLFGISIIFQRLLWYFPGLLQRSLAEGGLQRCLREEKKLGVYSLVWRDTPFRVRRFQCGMVVANSTCGICQVDGSAFSSPRMVEWYQLAQISCPRRCWFGISDKATLSRLQPNFGHKLKSGLKNLDNFSFSKITLQVVNFDTNFDRNLRKGVL